MTALCQTPLPQPLAVPSAASAQRARITRFMAKFLNKTMEWYERAAQRRMLAGLDTRMLKDIGLTSADVEREIAKPFWRP